MTPQCGGSADCSPTKIATGLNWRSATQIQIDLQRMHFCSKRNCAARIIIGRQFQDGRLSLIHFTPATGAAEQTSRLRKGDR